MPRIAPVALASDLFMEYPLHAATSSVLRAISPDWEPHFYLSLHGFTPMHLDRLRRTLDLAQKPYRIHLLPEIDLRRYAGFRPLHGNLMPFNRLLMPDAIDQERFLYLDTDTVTRIDISPVFEGDMDGRTLGAVLSGPAKNSGDARIYIDEMGFPPDGLVFNSGVLLFHAARWRQQNPTPAMLEYCKKGYPNGDQPVLNYFFHGKCFPLDPRMNTILYPQDARPAPVQGIFHFVGSPKPWDLGGEIFNRHAYIYNHALRETTVPQFARSRYLQKRNYARARHLGGSYYRAFRQMFGRR